MSSPPQHFPYSSPNSPIPGNIGPPRGRSESPLEILLHGRARTLKGTVNALLEEIERRETLHKRVADSIEAGLSGRRFRLENLRYLKLPYAPEVLFDRKRLEEALGAGISELEAEWRKELVECWRDTAALRRYLLSALKDYWELWRRQELLRDR